MEMTNNRQVILEPAQFCAYLLHTIEASEGRRKRRKRDTTPDAIGLQIKRDLIERAIEQQPRPEEFEGWLLQQVLEAPAGGLVHALCTEILAEYQIASYDKEFVRWLAAGAPSANAETD
jgi:hypothetical protein